MPNHTTASSDGLQNSECLSLKDVELVDMFVRQRASLFPQPSHQFPNETLIYHGYLGCSSLYPTVAISLRTLAAYRQIHRTCPRLSVQAQCKALCHLHDIPYRPYLDAQFSAAYDVYLEIVYRVDALMKVELQQDSPHWRLKNSCPACFYKLKDEPSLGIEWLVSIDGNNSLKRWKSSTYGLLSRSDSRKPRTDYWVDKEAVDRYKDQVKSKSKSDEYADDWVDVALHEEESFTCVDCWRNAGPEQRKKMFSIFEESGIFIASCRHHFILLACDMIQSGELAKYPLAIVDRLLSVYGRNGGCAYDIGCAFSST
ncbi:hypothetical protein SERLA73DRAFT_109190 [Serpula lacrymans var. lacrymans S7.3]|uniref:CxC1-like cysteine cluster associated with KDZ transposases domain-containing protein n=1 Tax=Serpula lacrymans var. lacrymans (strain S7.3) TaxID=936435 RepID=F8Q0T7_SERL3|nr:hypothetical protein SERLA73DRAFT_109190 [Serpula lacrymans var. lacrymans S7.3]